MLFLKRGYFSLTQYSVPASVIKNRLVSCRMSGLRCPQPVEFSKVKV